MSLFKGRIRMRRRRAVKYASFFMDKTCLQQRRAIYRELKRNRKQKREEIDGDFGTNKLNSSDNYIGGIDKLPDDVLINILSHMSLKEAARASAIARRWKYLWRFMNRTLEFHLRGETGLGEFVSWVNNILQLHRGRYIEGMVVSMNQAQREYYIGPENSLAIDSWLYFAVRKEVHRLELIISLGMEYEFPSIDKLTSHLNVVVSPFHELRTLILAEVQIKDEVVHYILASCLNLEELCISGSYVTNNIKVVDPPNLRVLKLNGCQCIKSAEISAVNLVSLSYGGAGNGLLLKELHNLRELTVTEQLYNTFVSKPKEQSWYLDQLVKLVVNMQETLPEGPIVDLPEWPLFYSLKRLEVRVTTMVGGSLLFFTSLINASPHLCEFRIEMLYEVIFWARLLYRMPFPVISGPDAVKFNHRSLKVVEMGGFIGCSSEKELLLELLKNAPLIEKVVINTKSDYYEDESMPCFMKTMNESRKTFGDLEMGAATQTESLQRARHLVSQFANKINFVVT